MIITIGRISLAALPLSIAAFPANAGEFDAIAGVPFDFVLFGLILLGITLLHRHTLAVGLAGLVAIACYRLISGGFSEGSGMAGLVAHFQDEWVYLANLLCLLTGFAFLSRHFEKSRASLLLPRCLPNDWKGNFALLVAVFLLSSLLDNIAAALIGGAMAHILFRGKVHIGFLVAIVASANAGGSGSVVGGTTTTMMWIDGIGAASVLDAYIAAVVALCVTAFFAARQQQAHAPMAKCASENVAIDKARVGIVVFILAAAILANVVVTVRFSQYADRFPFIGVAVWLAILISAPIRRPDWEILPQTFKGAVFLLSLIASATMMPVDRLPLPSPLTSLTLGGLSALFDNIPITTLALKQGGYDWGVLAYAVGFGGSLLWFGSSAGVALSTMFPEAKSVSRWVRHGWHVLPAYLAGFAAIILLAGWHPDPARESNARMPLQHQEATTSRIADGHTEG